MSPSRNPLSPLLLSADSSLSQRLGNLHESMLEKVPAIERIACALHDPQTGELKTFINSNRSGEPITAYHFKIADSPSLSHIMNSGEPRVIDEIQQSVTANAEHSRWLLSQGYRSSYTVPMFDSAGFMGLIFFDSLQARAFTETMQRDLLVYSTLINLTVSSEIAAINSMIASAHVARDFANLRDFETGAHLERMAQFSEIIARNVASVYGLSDESIHHIRLFAPLHDIGKIGIPDSILLKPGALDLHERDIMKSHVTLGAGMIDTIIADFTLALMPDSKLMRNIVACHHEFMDGSGYPAGLSGDAVPVEARIVTVSDIFDALTSKRPYKAAWSIADAAAELRKMSAAGKLDSVCVDALLQDPEKLTHIIEKYQD
jgi:HD-GYP domain-containing protein (c-di-GMP phosphodiesterase class II)